MRSGRVTTTPATHANVFTLERDDWCARLIIKSILFRCNFNLLDLKSVTFKICFPLRENWGFDLFKHLCAQLSRTNRHILTLALVRTNVYTHAKHHTLVVRQGTCLTECKNIFPASLLHHVLGTSDLTTTGTIQTNIDRRGNRLRKRQRTEVRKFGRTTLSDFDVTVMFP
ncbi:hypothetical protein T265_08628 [Opisthorchis viverrini]|uniref:Uncharacterized protein n=1 Tax=Opisthorchis viverrini TaxID=6198 RepID=A0A074Z8G4_OPIVI|nr:hypothetical protein T265_08628 [Opisthorchis viverrini]KER23506.1 hypothetical protein T265_08628 [Opisthorchis viverrini]